MDYASTFDGLLKKSFFNNVLVPIGDRRRGGRRAMAEANYRTAPDPGQEETQK
jgi:hypothetical protein